MARHSRPRLHRCLGLGLALTLGLGSLGCVLPPGDPVILDRRAGKWWSGDGVLLERSKDGEYCRVAVRGRALAVERPWVPCRYVHERPSAR